MKKIMSLTTLAIAGGVTLGVLGLNTVAQADTADDEQFVKRDEDNPSLVLVDDDDDDDTYRDRDLTNTVNTVNTKNTVTNNTNNNTWNTKTGTKNSLNSKNSRDNTRSNHTAVSKNTDRSRGDKTRDWTRDGGDLTRDRSANHTNDRSKNDTRR